MRRRRLIQATAAGIVLPWFASGLARADVARFSLGVASGQPHASGMVLWTRLTGDALPALVPVRWEVATDHLFSTSSRVARRRLKPSGRTACTPSRRGSTPIAGTVADLKPDYDDPASPVVASEFCGTSITSLGLAQSRLGAARPFNPHIRYGRSDQRGYMSFELGPKQLAARLQVVDRPLDPASAVTTAARYVVEAARPGPVPA